MAEHEKDIDAEIKREHEKFDREIGEYLNRFRPPGNSQGLSPGIQRLRQAALSARRHLALPPPKQQKLLR